MEKRPDLVRWKGRVHRLKHPHLLLLTKQEEMRPARLVNSWARLKGGKSLHRNYAGLTRIKKTGKTSQDSKGAVPNSGMFKFILVKEKT